MQREGRGGERRLHQRLAFVGRVDNRASVAHARRGHTGRVKSGRVVHRCICSACRSHLCVELCIVVVAVFSAAADAVLIALEVHPATIAGNPKRKREVRRLHACRGREAPGQYSGEHDAHKTTACTLSLRGAR